MKKVIIASLFLVLVLTGCRHEKGEVKIISPEEAKAMTEKFINENLLPQGRTASVKEVSEEDGLYKVIVDVGSGTDIDSYLTKDGKTFFPQAMDIKKTEEETKKAQASAPAAVVKKKQDKPEVELFVMSHCPYGTQIEKGILPVLETLGGKIDFELKFCDYAMHSMKELQEQMQQYCVQEQGLDKLMVYLESFLRDSDSDLALTSSGVNASKIKSCVSQIDKRYKVSANFEDKSTYKGSYPSFKVHQDDNDKYGIGGSPALVINGEKIASERDSSSLLKAICSGFNNVPEECNTQLSSARPSAGFGAGTSASSSGSCN